MGLPLHVHVRTFHLNLMNYLKQRKQKVQNNSSQNKTKKPCQGKESSLLAELSAILKAAPNTRPELMVDRHSQSEQRSFSSTDFQPIR